MGVPNFQKMMRPILEAYSSGEVLRPRDIETFVANKLKLSIEDQNELIPSKTETVLRNRVSWAVFDLLQASLLERVKRGFYRITQQGITELGSSHEITREYLKKYPSFLDFMKRSKKDIKIENSVIITDDMDPESQIEKSFLEINSRLESEILENLKNINAIRFERIVIELMEKMNYGIGSITPKSHDGGIDGIIDEDELGLDKIYLQAKRYSSNKINEKEMRDFIGALGCSPVRKGVFITTSFFSTRAINLANTAQGKIIKLIDGLELSKLMLKHCIGLKIKDIYSIKEIDNDFFDD